MIDFVRRWSERTGISAGRFIRWLHIAASKFYSWQERYGRVNEHKAWNPHDFWLEPWERQAILDFQGQFPLEGYCRLTFMMLDAKVVAVSPASVWRVLHHAGRLSRWNTRPSKKGRGFHAPGAPHEHWHVDDSYLNLGGTFYYLASVLDGYRRCIVQWDIRTSMTAADIELILQRAKERFPDARPRIISDNGPQFIARDFKEFIRLSGMTHVRTSPFYPQSNGKIERWHQSPKSRMPSSRLASFARGCPPPGLALRRALQHRPVAQRSLLRHPPGHAGRSTAGNPGPARSQARSRSVGTSKLSSRFLLAAFSDS